MAHKRMMTKLLQVRAHLILCFRADPKIEVVKEDGKTRIVPKESLIGYKGWIPVTEKNLPYEATVSFMMIADQPGVPHPIKLQDQHRALFPAGEPVTEESGKGIAAWAAGDGIGKPRAQEFASLLDQAQDATTLDAVAKSIEGAKMSMRPSEVDNLRARYKAKRASLAAEAA
jgi:hypothetical protein